MTMNRQLTITLSTLILATLFYWYLHLPPPWPVALSWWQQQLGPLWGGVKGVLPGARAGFFVGRHGVLLGAIVGFLGRLAVMLPVLQAAEPGSSALIVLSHAAVGVLGFGVVSAAGGGTGELLRSHLRRG
jgi:hypothetical protein